ncbi:MAG: proline racemase family protein [Saprospiraceae bacterium]|nr:proline racemase family protein [Saprospiraceae bacterium]
MPNTYKNILQQTHFSAPKHWHQIHTIDMHTGGEPLRVILNGFPELKGNNILEYRNYVRDNYDYLRKALMHEPRGHADMYGCLLLPPNDEEGDFGILFLHNEGYSTMCGHAIIAISTLAVQMGWVEYQEPFTTLHIDAPCGRITSFVHINNGIIQNVSFHCVPSFVLALDLQIDVPQIGKVSYDIAYGGAFYAYVNTHSFKLDLTPKNYNLLIRQGMAIKKAIIASEQKIDHPFEEDLSFLYGTIFIGGPISEGVDSRNVCIFADGEVDRCPTGSGVSGRMAIHYLRKEIGMGEEMSIESITGSVFKGSIVKEVEYGPFQAVIPRVTGTAHITGQHQFLIDPQDPFKNGFFLR